MKNKFLASASADKTVKIWETNHWTEMYTFRGHTNSVYCLVINEDESLIISGSFDKTIKIWNVNSVSLYRTLLGHTKCVVDVSIFGNLLVSASRDETIRVWNLETGTCGRVLSEHTNTVSSLGFSSCGSFFVSGDTDCTVRVWRKDGEMCQYIPTNSRINSIAVAEKKIVSGHDDGSVKVWDLD